MSDEAEALALLTAFWAAPPGDKLADPAFVELLDEALGDWPTVRSRMIGLMVLSSRLIDVADEDGNELLAKAGIDMAGETA